MQSKEFMINCLGCWVLGSGLPGSGSTQGPSWGYLKVNSSETLSIFGDKFPQNGSKNEQRAPRTSMGCPHIWPFVGALQGMNLRLCGSGVWALSCRGLGSGYGVQVLGCRVWGAGFGVQGLRCRVWGAGFGVQGLSTPQMTACPSPAPAQPLKLTTAKDDNQKS